MSKADDILKYATDNLERIQELAEDYEHGDDSSLDEIYTLSRHAIYKLEELRGMIYEWF